MEQSRLKRRRGWPSVLRAALPSSPPGQRALSPHPLNVNVCVCFHSFCSETLFCFFFPQNLVEISSLHRGLSHRKPWSPFGLTKPLSVPCPRLWLVSTSGALLSLLTPISSGPAPPLGQVSGLTWAVGSHPGFRVLPACLIVLCSPSLPCPPPQNRAQSWAVIRP